MPNPPQHAFTLLELVTVIAILAILVTMGVPAFQQFSQKQAVSAALHSLHSDLLLARSRAIYEDELVVACPGSAAPGCSEGAAWEDGWIIFTDNNGDRTYDSSETLIRSGMPIEQMAIRSSSGRRDFRFYPNGSTPGSNGSITFCGPGGPTLARKLVISNLGRIRRDQATNIDASKCAQP